MPNLKNMKTIIIGGIFPSMITRQLEYGKAWGWVPVGETTVIDLERGYKGYIQEVQVPDEFPWKTNAELIAERNAQNK